MHGTHCVVCYVFGRFRYVVSGLGRNRGTCDSDHSKRTAQRYARELNRTACAGYDYRVETVT